MKKTVKNLILKEEKVVLDLEAEAGQLENQVKETAIDLIVQKKKSEELFEKVKYWQKSFDKNFESVSKKVEHAQVEIDHNNKLKSYNLALKILQKKVLTKTVVSATVLLNKKFELQADAQVYLDNVLGRLEGT
jgi:hypothetical protein